MSHIFSGKIRHAFILEKKKSLNLLSSILFPLYINFKKKQQRSKKKPQIFRG